MEAATETPKRDRLTSILADANTMIVKLAIGTLFCGIAGVAFHRGFAMLDIPFADTDKTAFMAFAWIGFGFSSSFVAVKTFREIK